MEPINTWAEEYLRIIDTMWEEGDYSGGRTILDKIFLEEPDCAKAHMYAGWYAHYQSKNRKQAAMHYELALKFDPSLESTYHNYVELLIEDNDLTNLKRVLEIGLAQRGLDKTMLYNNYGRMLELKGDYRAASRYYKDAMRHTMNFFVMSNLKSNRRRVRSKYHLFSAVYSVFI